MTDEIGLVEGKSKILSESFVLESGAVLPSVTVAYETYGELNLARSNAILVLHALTGDAHVAGFNHPEDRIPGWWDQLVGPGKALDTTKYFVICSNVLGGCYGTTGPASINPETGSPYGMGFPVITIRDMVHLQKRLLDWLGIPRLKSAIGGSMGGMQALEWAICYPDLLDTVIPISTSGKLSAQCMAFNRVQRQAIIHDADWNGGDYYQRSVPRKGLALAREIATITYKSDESWTLKFGRNFAGEGQDFYNFDGRFEVENYLDYQGRKLVSRFDANSYLYLTKAMDLHDVSRRYGSLADALGRIKAKTLSLGISSDFLYPSYLQKEIAQVMERQGGRARYVELQSPYGHDAFLIEFQTMNKIIKGFLEEEC